MKNRLDDLGWSSGALVDLNLWQRPLLGYVRLVDLRFFSEVFPMVRRPREFFVLLKLF